MRLSQKPSKNKPDFLSRLHKDIKIISNIDFVFDKINKDGYLQKLQECFNGVFSSEIDYSISELLKRKRKGKKMDLPAHLTTNTHIFKENLKTITLYLSKLKSRSDLER